MKQAVTDNIRSANKDQSINLTLVNLFHEEAK